MLRAILEYVTGLPASSREALLEVFPETLGEELEKALSETQLQAVKEALKAAFMEALKRAANRASNEIQHVEQPEELDDPMDESMPGGLPEGFGATFRETVEELNDAFVSFIEALLNMISSFLKLLESLYNLLKAVKDLFQPIMKLIKARFPILSHYLCTIFDSLSSFDLQAPFSLQQAAWGKLWKAWEGLSKTLSSIMQDFWDMEKAIQDLLFVFFPTYRLNEYKDVAFMKCLFSVPSNILTLCYRAFCLVAFFLFCFFLVVVSNSSLLYYLFSHEQWSETEE